MEYFEGFCAGWVISMLIFRALHDDNDDNDGNDDKDTQARQGPLPGHQPYECNIESKPINNKEK